MQSFLKCLLILPMLMLVQNIVFAQEDPIEGVWFNEEKSAKIKIYRAKNQKFYGKIVWLERPEEDGKPRVDKNNPDKSKRTEPINGLLILKGFVKDGDKEYEDGTIYDPKNGKTYSCIIKHNGEELDVRGYVGFSWIGRTTVWSKAE
ncbi:MAG: DUF2147 domain-containing protein [Chitinophagales bacterium]|nr:DUF2147 domain-containing protein [Chitinophagaceae bacterium]MCB9064441.1 DUF2147 domain-containing protein [Chitinophagales bacterium]